MKNRKLYDVIIVGGSYAGLAAGLALGRAIRRVLIIDSGNPANKQTPHSHNFLTNDGKTPTEIHFTAKQQVSMYDTVTLLEATVRSCEIRESAFEVQTTDGSAFTGQKLIIATGIKDIMPDILGFDKCWGISVLHCPYCHGYEVRGRQTGILANGDNAFELASLIFNWTKNLTIYTNGKCTLTEEQETKVSSHNISIVQTKVEQFEQINGHIRNIILEDGKREAVTVVYARLPFVQHSDFAKHLRCEQTIEGYIMVDAAQKTSVPGVYACGDNTTRMRTVANAVSMGTTTGIMVNRELIEESF